ncbi:aminotransferase class I/II-fold pyridoxal phosphate-dependent enzyme [Pisciglobus halotolerans]|uniref:Cystathionine beta-lyase family protein involved in aluminum resistance n=1 Tax=Pisciglobus halotolerans TaxID=745365 RepID=A0A1I3CFM4_9LACT|nr:methionine gamma-lyase family protein [Pisciglobus halotolerans]SFH73156.1 Cystathionine beta-lyase family protein involved in aluminum resistance [Pisciglobus halotolerans]
MSWYSQYTPELREKIEQVEEKIQANQEKIHETALVNQKKVLDSFRKKRVTEQNFNPSTGYGYDDFGRDTLEEVYADVFKAESGLVRPQIISGTHAITTALFGVMRPGDDLLYITGEPYDTLLEVVGVTGNGIGSFKEYQMGFDYVPLLDNGKPDYEEIKKQITLRTKVVAIQRSRGYATRPSFTIAQIEEMIRFVKEINPELIIFVDNCYGEFVEEKEPIEIGADLMAGSLIKNPGGGLAKTGGYIVGKKDLVEACGYRLTSPGIGKEAGASLSSLPEMYQGFFMAPHTVGEALKGAVYTAALLESCGVESSPAWNDERTDLIQTISLNDEDKMVKFAQTIQKYSPVNAHVMPVAAYMPGYEDDVIMAAGTFIQGSSIELTADGPIRPPYTLYVQGGLTYEHVKLAVTAAVADLYF